VAVDDAAFEVFKKGYAGQSPFDCRLNIFLHPAPGMITEGGVHMVITAQIHGRKAKCNKSIM
jgi:hypothetical protein